MRRPERGLERGTTGAERWCIDITIAGALRDRLVRQAGAALHRRVLVRDEVRAFDASESLSGREGAVRVVIAGSGITSGWGVSTHGLAIVGAVQRSLAQRLDRPVDAVQTSRVGALLSHALDVLDGRLDDGVDALVLALGWSDAFALTPPHRWAETLRGVLDVLRRDRPGLPVAVVGVPPMDRLGVAGPFGPLVRRRGERLNDASRVVVDGRSDTVFVPLDAPVNRELRPWGSPEAYHAWSLPIAAALQSLLAERPAPAAALVGTASRTSADPALGRPSAPTPPPAAPEPALGARRPARIPRRRIPGEALDALRMRTWIRAYAMRVLEELGHPPRRGGADQTSHTVAPGPRPIRVLLLGAGLAVGYGVRSSDDAVDGGFARGLAAACGRGVVLENRAVPHQRLEQLVASLRGEDAPARDLVVWFPAFTDGLQHLRPAWWRGQLRGLVAALRAAGPVPILLTHMPVPAGLHPAALVARPRVHRLNRTLDRIASELEGVAAVRTEPFFPGDVGQKVTDRAYFTAVGGHLVPAAAALLDREPRGAV